MFQNICVGIHRYSALTYDVMKSYLTRVRDKKIRNGYITLDTKLGCYVIKFDTNANKTCKHIRNLLLCGIEDRLSH